MQGLLLVSKDCPPVFLTQSDSVCPTTNSTSSAFPLLSLHSRVGNTPSIPDHCVTLYSTLSQIPSYTSNDPHSWKTWIQNQNYHFNRYSNNNDLQMWPVKNMVWKKYCWVLEKSRIYLNISIRMHLKTCSVYIHLNKIKKETQSIPVTITQSHNST